MTAPEDGCSEGSAVSANGTVMFPAGAVSSSFPPAGSEELWLASGTAGVGGVSSLSAVSEKKKY